MIVTLIIILLLIIAFRYGFKRGFLMTLLNLSGYVVVFLVAVLLAKPMGSSLAQLLPQLSKNNDFTNIFYNVLSFWIVAIIGGVLYRFIAHTINGITKLPLISQLNALAGALFSSLLMYLVIFWGLLLMSAWPDSKVRLIVQDSSLAEWILNKTPLISNEVFNNINNGQHPHLQ